MYTQTDSGGTQTTGTSTSVKSKQLMTDRQVADRYKQEHAYSLL